MNKHHQSPIWRIGAPVPRHVAIIMDGNGRWAESRGLPRSAGHHMGVEAVRRTVRAPNDDCEGVAVSVVAVACAWTGSAKVSGQLSAVGCQRGTLTAESGELL